MFSIFLSRALIGLLSLFASVTVLTQPLAAADPFKDQFQPFAKKYCLSCHNNKEARGEFDFTRYQEVPQVVADFRRWSHVIEFIRGGEMPPEDQPQPTIEERKHAVDVLETILLAEAKKNAGDPGVIVPRRLSNTEYDRSIRALTGFDIRPTRDFPADPAAGEGFDNTGEALGMSPSLLKKYLSAAQLVSEHLVLKTDGISFAPFPVTSYNEQKKLTEQAIIDFYQSRAVKLSAYLEAAWRYQHRPATEAKTDLATWAARRKLSAKYLAMVYETLSQASEAGGSLEEVARLWKAIPPPTDEVSRPKELAKLESYIEFLQKKLPYKEEGMIRPSAGTWPIGQLDLRARIASRRDQFDPSNLKQRMLLVSEKFKAQPAKDKKAAETTIYLRIDPGPGSQENGWVIIHRPLFSKSNTLPKNAEDVKKQEVITLREALEKHVPTSVAQFPFGKGPAGKEIAADSLAIQAPAMLEVSLPTEFVAQLEGKQLLLDCELAAEGSEQLVFLQFSTGKRPTEAMSPLTEVLVPSQGKLAEAWQRSGEIFCRTFPNRFFYVDSQRGLAAGFHLVEGFFRDDRPLVEKVLTDAERQELDRLWQELDFVTQRTETLLRGFVWFERAERHVLHDKRFDFLRSEDPALVEEAMLARFEREYLEKLGVKLLEEKLQPEKPGTQFDLIHGFFEEIRSGLAKHQAQLAIAEERGLADVLKLAARAYRRPLLAAESTALRALYNNLRQRGQGVEASLRGTFTAVLMSPDFVFHLNEPTTERGVRPLSDSALASRLSYFLWASLPDEELLAAAAAGKLHNEEELVKQTRRMLQDERIDAVGREFLGQWLRYRDYLSKDPINAATFPGYDDALRQAMFEEPIRLTTYLIQNDKPITQYLHSDTTFVNQTLAKHYGGEIAKQFNSQSSQSSDWLQVTGLRKEGRGGLFGMGVVLTKNSAGERTSPVKRGFWTVHRLLGQHFPPPPADVPELPPGEKQATKTIRELLTEHVANPKCALCHVHFDGLGMALEGFDPIGRARTKDLAGRAIDNVAVLPNGTTAHGIPGLIDYIEKHRQADFVRTFCRKFLGYALGRSVLLTDQPLLMEMEAALAKNDHRFSVLFEMVVKSPQFRQRRSE